MCFIIFYCDVFEGNKKMGHFWVTTYKMLQNDMLRKVWQTEIKVEFTERNIKK